MNITMYNCSFGDCFKIFPEEETYRALYVDFGIHKESSRIDGITKEERYDDIISDMVGTESDFLLTHYHQDHFDGVIYLMENEDYKFDDVYIPNIWNIVNSIDVVKLILFKGLLEKSYLDKKHTLFMFLKAICKKRTGRVYFVLAERGNNIQGHYTALWPSEKIETPVLNYSRGRGEGWERLTDITRRLVSLMTRVSEENVIYRELTEEELNEFDELNDAYMELDELFPKDKNTQYNLNKWGNNISIVFHSKYNVKRNILFCGDVGNDKHIWHKIVDNICGDKDRHFDNYNVIKIPHHGTKDYYIDFSFFISRHECTLLIPNGNHARWCKYGKYSALANSTGSKVICSDRYECDSNCRGYCNCHRCEIIYPRVSITI